MASFPSVPRRREQRLHRGQRRARHLRGRAEALEERRRAVGERRQARERLVDPRRRDFQIVEHRRRLIGEAREAFHRGSELLEELREQLEVARERATMARGGLRDGVALHDEVGDSFAHCRKRLERLVGVDRQFRQHLVLAGEDRQHAVEFLQCGVGATNDHVEVGAAPGQPGAELVDQDREALALGQPRDVAEQVDVDRAVSVLHGKQVLARCLRVRGRSSSAGAAAACRQRAAASAGSRRTSRRSGPAGARCSWHRRGSP